MKRFLAWLLGCRHERTGFPITVWRTRGSHKMLITYQVCLDCGRQFHFDLTEWRRR